MAEASLENALAFNKHLRALSAAGIQFDLGDQSRTVSSLVEQADRNLALRSSLNQSVMDALAEDHELPAVYRSAMQSGLFSDHPTSVLESLSRLPWTGQHLRRVVGYSFIQPMILGAIAYVGFIVLCLNFVPTAIGIYDQLQQTPHWSIRLLQMARESMFVWGPLVPMLVILLMWRWFRVTELPQFLLPNKQRFSQAIRTTNFADQLRAMLEQGIPLPESLRLVGGMAGNRELSTAASALADAAAQETKLPVDDSRLECLPSLLRWALTTDLGNQSLPDILRFAVSTYHKKAEGSVAFWQLAWPAFCGALLGGAVVLFFGLCLFGPYVSLMKDLSQ